MRNSHLAIREATPDDQALIYVLVDKLKEHYFEDYQLQHGFTPEDLSDWIIDGNLSLITLNCLDIELVIGVVLIDDIHPEKLYGTLHLLIDPEHWRSAVKHHPCAVMLDYVFEKYGLRMLKAFPMKPQRSAMNLLKKHFFYFGTSWPNGAKFKGKLVPVTPCHLNRTYWNKKRADIYG